MSAVPPPLGMLAELTHRCPLACPYCSNPVDLTRRSGELDTATWIRVFDEAAGLGVLHVHLSGGEPTARQDIVELTAAASRAGLYTNLITSGIGLRAERMEALARAGLDHVQLSVQDVLPDEADRVAGLPGAHAAKAEAARAAIAAGLALTINAVVHRGNVERIPELVRDALRAGAGRIEVAHTQYHGWASRNRAALMPTRAQVERARADVARLRDDTAGAIAIDYVAPDHFARFPKPCMNGWGRRVLNVTPAGDVLPCHSAQTIPGLVFDNVRNRALRDIWDGSAAFEAFRGTAWMKQPCSSCSRRDIDFGGCRCQALALTGDARNTDPACTLSPRHDLIVAARDAGEAAEFTPRRFGRPSREVEAATSA